MADEENPLGGGAPFGVGPFGPLVGAAAAVATVFNMVVVTTATPITRTLYYQAKIAPPPQPPVEIATAESFSVTTGRVSSKSLFYQSRIGPPPVAAEVDNTGTFATWYVPLSRPLSRLPAETALYTPFVPGAAPQPTAAQWLPRWRGPPSYVPAPAGGSPFVPKEAVLENTVTPDKWLARFQGAVPVPPVHHTQPVFGYPYVAASNLTTTIEWLRAWPVPPRYQPAKIAAQPFVPKEATRENTITPDKWLFRWQGAVPGRKPIHTQPFYRYPYEAASNLTTTLEWLQAWRGPPRYQPAKIAAQPFVPREAVLENTVTPDKWLRAFGIAAKRPAVWRTQPALQIYPPAFITPDQWMKPLGVAVKRPAAQPTQPVLGYYEIAPNLTTSIEWLQAWKGPPRYQPAGRHTQPFLGRPQTAVPDGAIGGPADEPERVVCVLAASRVATEPLLSRDAIVPVALRTATVPELDRVVITLDSSEVVDSNLYRDDVCPPFSNAAGIPIVGGVATPEGEDAILLEDGSYLLLEGGDHILLEGTIQEEDSLLLEGDDHMLLESGDNILLEE